METGIVRNLEEIQESETSSRPSRAGALVLASLAGACIVFAGALIMKGPSRPKTKAIDPLGDLVAKSHPAGAKALSDDVATDVTFPSMLSDSKNPTTALQAARGPAAAASPPFALPPGAPTEPPPATERLPVVPLPAQAVLAVPSTEAVAQDSLTTKAREVSREEGAEVAAGSAGNFQLQVSSFKTQPEGEAFAAALRRRGHHAYVEAADVPGRGTWYRVRVGPFKHKRSAQLYRQDFEAKERIVTFIVDPPKNTVDVRATAAADD